MSGVANQNPFRYPMAFLRPDEVKDICLDGFKIFQGHEDGKGFMKVYSFGKYGHFDCSKEKKG